jgi:hypothetical protein
MAEANSSDIAYSRESEIIGRYRTLAHKESITPVEAGQALQEMCTNYERLLDDSKLLTSIGDRLQRKLKSANLMMREQAEEIKRVNANVQEKNIELQLTVDELTRVKASRRARTFVLGLALVLFVLSELIEQFLDDFLSSTTVNRNLAFYISLFLKAGLVLLFKPAETFMENRIMQRSAKEKAADKLQKKAELKAEQELVEILDPVELAKRKRAEARKKAKEEAMAREALAGLPVATPSEKVSAEGEA